MISKISKKYETSQYESSHSAWYETEHQFSFEVFGNFSKVYVSVEDLVVRRMHVDPDRLLFMFDECILIFLKSDSFYLPSVKTPKMAANPLKKTEIRRYTTKDPRFDRSSSVTVGQCDNGNQCVLCHLRSLDRKSHYMRKSVFCDLRLTDSFTARNRVGYICLSLHCYLNTMLSRVHLAFHARIQDFSSGGVGVRVNLTKKKPDNVFFSPQLILLMSNG